MNSCRRAHVEVYKHEQILDLDYAMD
jgi:hypothetical protein